MAELANCRREVVETVAAIEKSLSDTTDAIRPYGQVIVSLDRSRFDVEDLREAA